MLEHWITSEEWGVKIEIRSFLRCAGLGALLYDSLEREPGWRFTARLKYWTECNLKSRGGGCANLCSETCSCRIWLVCRNDLLVLSRHCNPTYMNAVCEALLIENFFRTVDGKLQVRFSKMCIFDEMPDSCIWWDSVSNYLLQKFFCIESLLYESSERKPGWRFTVRYNTDAAGSWLPNRAISARTCGVPLWIEFEVLYLRKVFWIFDWVF